MHECKMSTRVLLFKFVLLTNYKKHLIISNEVTAAAGCNYLVHFLNNELKIFNAPLTRIWVLAARFASGIFAVLLIWK